MRSCYEPVTQVLRSSTMRSNRRSLCHFGIVLFAVLFLGVGARAQTALPTPTPAPASSTSLEKDFFKNILRDQKAIWTSPLHVRGRDARYLMPLAFGTAALI